MAKRPSLMYLLKKSFHASYGSKDLEVQLGFCHLVTRHLFPFGLFKGASVSADLQRELQELEADWAVQHIYVLI